MLEILKFVLSDFWVFCGTIILIYVSGMSAALVVAAAFGTAASYSLVNVGRKSKNKEEENEGAA